VAPATDAALQPRAERLAAIRRAVEAGEYDSEELLAKAFDRMLQRYQSGLAAD
jgi:HAMP domain-containing protein